MQMNGLVDDVANSAVRSMINNLKSNQEEISQIAYQGLRKFWLTHRTEIIILAGASSLAGFGIAALIYTAMNKKMLSGK